ncbi:MAG TPA: hypothetical protein VKY19_02265 [Ktedonosporobacter sp.]|jgi:hypothetical protein|nr:hypothetical protein [Ktedonosporobacter sp.]
MKELNRHDITSLLQELGAELEKKFSEPVQVMLIGGAYMILTLHNRQSTEDIDIYPLNIPDSTRPDKQTKHFYAAIREIARRHGLPRKWLNDVSFSLLGGLSPQSMELWTTYGMLQIFWPPRDFILALKLFADRRKDRPDIEALLHDLDITTREQAQAILDRYIESRFQREYRVHLTLDTWFP